MISPPNSLYFVYDSIKLVQFCICYNLDPPIHKILVPPQMVNMTIAPIDVKRVVIITYKIFYTKSDLKSQFRSKIRLVTLVTNEQLY